MTRINTLFLGSAILLGLSVSAPAFAGDFAALDTNSDGQITFAEYRAHATANGATTTLAAQDFTRMAQGDAFITEDEYFLADAMKDDPFALRAMGTSVTYEAPVQSFETAPVEYVEPSPVANSEAYEVEMVDPPVVEETAPVEEAAPADELIDAPKPTEIIKPLEDVAGEVETTTNAPELEPVEPTPMEEGTEDASETESDIYELEDEAGDVEPEDGGMN